MDIDAANRVHHWFEASLSPVLGPAREVIAPYVDPVSQMLEWTMLIIATSAFLLNLVLRHHAIERHASLIRERRNGVLMKLARFHIRSTRRRLFKCGCLTGVCALLLSLPNALDLKAVLMKVLILALCIEAADQSQDDNRTSREVNHDLDTLEGVNH